MAKRKNKAAAPDGAIATNRKALRDYQVLERFEAGIILKGTEVKSIRAGRINLRDSFCRVDGGEVYLHGCDIQPYAQASHEQHLAKCPRKLLLHKKEILKIAEAGEQKGLTVICLQAYWKNRRVKLEIAIARGKAEYDQRQDIKKREARRETEREIARLTKGR